jgi:GNAT superfamily N-acetyltransferase
MLAFQRERFAHIIYELPPLFAAQWAELGAKEELSPNWAKYAGMDAAEVLHCITARDGAQLVGYYFALISPSLHYSTLTAYSDLVFLQREHRKGLTGKKFIAWVENYLAAVGVKTVYLTKRADSGYGKLFARLGYTPHEEVYRKAL